MGKRDDDNVINGSIDNKYYVVSPDGDVIKEINSEVTILEGRPFFNADGSITPYIPKYKKIHSGFVKLNDVAFSMLKADGDKVAKLLPYIGYQNGVLSFSNGKKIKSVESFNRVINASRNTSKKFMEDLVRDDVIHKHSGHGVYYTFNPYVCMRGEKITIDLFDDFKDSKWSHINNREEMEN